MKATWILFLSIPFLVTATIEPLNERDQGPNSLAVRKLNKLVNRTPEGNLELNRRQAAECQTPCSFILQAGTCATDQCICQVIDAVGPSAISACAQCFQQFNATAATEISAFETLCQEVPLSTSSSSSSFSITFVTPPIGTPTSLTSTASPTSSSSSSSNQGGAGVVTSVKTVVASGADHLSSDFIKRWIAFVLVSGVVASFIMIIM
jgi:hypothetical protein